MNFGLRIELWWQPGAFSLVLPQALPNIMAALLYLLVSFWVLFMRRHDFTRMNLKAWGLFVTGLVLIVPANAVLVLYRTQERMLILPSMSVVAATPAVPLIGMVIVAAIAFWGGVGPGLCRLLVGIDSVLVWNSSVRRCLCICRVGGHPCLFGSAAL
jgi:hypothetical protein